MSAPVRAERMRKLGVRLTIRQKKRAFSVSREKLFAELRSERANQPGEVKRRYIGSLRQVYIH